MTSTPSLRVRTDGVLDVLRSAGARVLGGFVCASAAVVIFVTVLIGVGGDTVYSFVTPLIAVTAPLMWWVSRICAAEIVVCEQGVLVQNWFTRQWIPWAALVRVGEHPLTFVLADGRVIRPAVPDDQLPGDASERIERARPRAEGRTDPTVRSEIDLAPGVLLALLALFLGCAVLAALVG
jgi:hypothetical protein